MDIESKNKIIEGMKNTLKIQSEKIEEQQKEIEHLKYVMRKYDKYANWSYAKRYGIEL